jgi:hypothetical protein
MYYKDASSYPQTQGPYGGIKRSPLPSYGYANGNMMYGANGNMMYGANGNMMYGNVMDYFSNPWVMIIGVIILVLIIVWLMSGKKDYYRPY